VKEEAKRGGYLCITNKKSEKREGNMTAIFWLERVWGATAAWPGGKESLGKRKKFALVSERN